MRRVILVFFLLVLSFLAFTTGFIAYFHINDLVLPNIRTAGTNLGGLSLKEAKSRLEKINRGRECIFRIKDKEIAYKLSEIGLSYDVEGICRSAFEVGRKGWLKAFKEAWVCLAKGMNLRGEINLDEKKWGTFVASLRKELDKPAVNARPIVKGGRIVGIMPAKEGYGLDEKRLLQMLSKGEELATYAECPMTVLLPKVREEDLEGMELICEFSTPLGSSSQGRLENLKRAVSAIDGTLLSPKEKFSFNERVGPRITERGYKVAPVMVKGELVPGIGGGVCQVSTTLYNVVLLAGLKLEKRGHHARPVKYVSPGRDATVVWGYTDLVFSNDKDYPIYIQGEVKGGRLTFRLFGKKEFEEVKLLSEVETKTDGTIIAKTYRLVKTGEEKRKELISTDIYRPLPKKTTSEDSLPSRTLSEDRWRIWTNSREMYHGFAI